MSFEVRVIDPEVNEDDAVEAVGITWRGLQRAKGKQPQDVYIEMFGTAGVVTTGLYDEAGRLCAASAHMRAAEYAVLLTIVADQPRQGQGSALLEGDEGNMASEGATQMVLTADNEVALLFFAARGYAELPGLEGTPDAGRLLAKPLPNPTAE